MAQQRNPDAFRILVIEDDPRDADFIRKTVAEIGPAFSVTACVSSLREGIEECDQTRFDVGLLDLTLPDSNGIETFKTLHAHAPDLPLIVLSGVDDEEMAILTVHEGAQDHLVKGRINAELLARTMRHGIERARAEEALLYERNLLHSLLNNIPDRIFFKDLSSRFVRINRIMAELFHLESPLDAIGKSDADFFSPEHAQPALDDERKVIATGEAMIGKAEKEMFPDGSVAWVLTTKAPLRDSAGRIIGTFGTSRDISSLKKMEDDLAAERNTLRGMIENIPDSIFVKDIHGHYLVDNAAHRRFLGIDSEQDIVGKTVFDFFPKEAAQQYHEDDEQVIESATPLINHEEETVDRSGQKRWLSTTKVPLRDEDGVIFGMVCIGRDITSRKLAQERLQKANAELKEAHEQLSSMQLQLIEAEKMKSVGRLAAGVAHEVKNPLAIITMGLDYLTQQEYPDPAIPGILLELEDAVKRADDVIKGMLDYSAPKTLAVGDGDLNQVIEQSLVLVRGEMNPAKHKIVKELAPDLPPARIDRLKMGQVFVNVLVNALHAMPEGGILGVRTYSKQLTGVGANIGDERSEKFRVGNTVIVAEVTDTGHGIPEDKLTKVFDPFFTTKPTGKGTGLGLSVTRSIIDLHGGTIELRNRESGGAQVCLMLPGAT